MYDYKIVEQVTRKKKRLSGVLKKTMVFFAVVFVVMGITISQAFMLAGFCLAGLYFISMQKRLSEDTWFSGYGASLP